MLAPKRRAGLFLLTVVSTVFAMVPAVASPSDEQAFVASMNASRASQGLAPLAGYSDLVDDARRHTGDMIARGEIFHSTQSELAGATTGWSALGENVGMGPNPTILHQAFMSSSSHRANILGDFDRVGVGADRHADGTMFVTVIFMKTAAPATTTTTTTTTTTAPPPTTTTTTPPPPPPASKPVPVPVVATAPDRTATPAPVPTWSGLDDVEWLTPISGERSFCVIVGPRGSVCAE